MYITESVYEEYKWVWLCFTKRKSLLKAVPTIYAELLPRSEHTLTWQFTGTWNPGLARFYRVPNGGLYSSSHMITADDHFRIRNNDLILVNVSAIHEGQYYCIYNENKLNSTTPDCIAVQGESQCCWDNLRTSYVGEKNEVERLYICIFTISLRHCTFLLS